MPNNDLTAEWTEPRRIELRQREYGADRWVWVDSATGVELAFPHTVETGQGPVTTSWAGHRTQVDAILAMGELAAIWAVKLGRLPKYGATEEEARLLTLSERLALDALGTAWGHFQDLVGDGPTRADDLREVAARIHDLQNAVLAQAAARAMPGVARLMGETF